MKIVQMLSASGVNGAVIQCLTLARALANRGHDVIVVGREGSWISRQILADPLRYVVSDFARWRIQSLRGMAQWLEDESVDVVHSHSSGAQIYSVFLKLLMRIPIVATAHHSKIQPHWMLHDYIIANSEATRRRQIRWNRVRRSRIETIHCLIDHPLIDPSGGRAGPRWRTQFGADPDHRLIGVVGDVNYRKNQRMLIRALPRILAQVPAARLALVGDPQPDYEALIRRDILGLGIESHIHWAGFQDDIPGIMRALDLLVACPRNEPFGMTVPEAMAAARPTVATRVGGLCETVVDGETGFLVPRHDQAALAEAIVKLLSNQLLAARMGQAGRRRFRAMFNNEAAVDRHEAIFQMVAQQRGRGITVVPQSWKSAA